MEKTTEAIISGTAAIVCLVLAILQLTERGAPLNNSYLFAPKEKKSEMDKSPYFKQSGIIFSLLTVILILITAASVFQAVFLSYIAMGFGGATVIYALVSTFLIEKISK